MSLLTAVVQAVLLILVPILAACCVGVLVADVRAGGWSE